MSHPRITIMGLSFYIFLFLQINMNNHELRTQCLVTSATLLCYGASFIGIERYDQEKKNFIFKKENRFADILPQIHSGEASVNPIVYEGNRKFLLRELLEHKKRFQ